MSKAFNTLITDYTTRTNDSAAANTTLGKALINEAIRLVVDLADLTHNQYEYTDTTVADTQAYQLDIRMLRPRSVSVTVGSTIYTPIEVPDKLSWDRLNSTSSSSDTPEYWFYDQEARQIELYPTPDGAADTMTVRGYRKWFELADAAVTETDVSVTAAGTTVTGVGSGWLTDDVVGKYIQFANLDYWYEITAVASDTSLTIREEAQKTIASGAATIDDLIPLPDGYEDLPLYYAMAKYFEKKASSSSLAVADRYEALFRERVENLKKRNRKTAPDILEQSSIARRNILDSNDYPTLS